MPTLNELTDQPEANVSDDDLLLIWETGAGSNNSRKVTRARLLKDVVRDGEDATLGTVDADVVNAPDGTIDELDVSTGLTVGGGSAIQAVLKGLLSVTPGDLNAGASETKTATLTGAQNGDVLLFSINTHPGGLHIVAWVSTTDTVTFRFTNLTSSTITGATYVARTIAIRAS